MTKRLLYNLAYTLIKNDYNLFNILKFAGFYGGGATPVPIPNTEVKSSSADGTAWLHVEE